MKLLVAAAALLLACFFVAACGGEQEPKTDQEAIDKLFRDYIKAFDGLDEGKLRRLYLSTCENLEAEVADTIRDWELFADTIDLEITRVEIRNLTTESAEALPVGTTFYPGQQASLTVQDYVPLAKEDGTWKIAKCDFTF